MEMAGRKRGARRWSWAVGSVLALAACAVLVWAVRSRADYVISWVGTGPLTESEAAAVSAAVARGGADQTGDGKIRTDIRQFSVDFSLAPGDPGYEDSRAQLDKLLDQTDDCALYLLEDPEGFQAAAGALADLAASPGEGEQRYIFWHTEGLDREVYLGRGTALEGADAERRFPGAGILFDAMTDGC